MRERHHGQNSCCEAGEKDAQSKYILVFRFIE
jgi:hypothetical protein